MKTGVNQTDADPSVAVPYRSMAFRPHLRATIEAQVLT